MSEQELIHLLNNQDKKAIAYLYDHYADALYGIVLRIVKKEEIAEDVLQEVFVKVWKNGHQYDARKARLFTWLMNIARNTAINKVQSKGFRKAKMIQNIENVVHTNSEQKTALNENHLDLKGHVNALDAKYRKVINLIYFQGFTQREVADHLDMPLGSVKSFVRIGLRELKKVFDYQKVISLIIVFLGL